jgi:TRAP-type C4-dicarboxylate transport system substrate-binding protein
VNKNTWAKLPDEVKKVLQEVAFELRDRHAKLAVETGEKSRKAFLAGGGKVVEVSEEERRLGQIAAESRARNGPRTPRRRGFRATPISAP